MNLDRLFQTDESTRNLWLRLVLAGVIAPHGAQKLLGLFGGYGFSGTMGFFTGKLGLPTPIAFLVIIIESFGALALAAGLLTRVAAAGLIAVMVGAVAMAHAPYGFFMNWFGNQAGEGFEYHLLVIAMAGVLVATGAGRASVDARIARRLAARSNGGAPVAATA
ncbi:MAG: DoxX family protein [Polyangiaceae bacterium]|jgi:putative oxidoreductase|nr:DoxX family protein [Polyangiaceae bacterium]